MMTDRCSWIALLLLLLTAGAGFAAEPFSLNYAKLNDSAKNLSPEDRSAEYAAVDLIRAGNYSLALSQLAALRKSNPNNSSVRILASYALLLAGNLVGAFDEARRAHDAPDGNSYKCWFLAKIALLNGQTAACEREVEHLKKAGDMVAETEALQKELRGN